MPEWLDWEQYSFSWGHWQKEEYMGGKKFLSQTPLCAKYCRCSDYPGQLFLLLYTSPDKNRPQQHWGTLTISAQTLEAFHLRNCSQYGHESSERLGCDYTLPHLCFWNGAYLCSYLLLHKFAVCEMLQVHLISNWTCSAQAFCKTLSCL